MADEADMAQGSVELYLEVAITAARRPHKGPPPVVVDGVTFCASCGDVIPPARVRALPGVGLCVTCQQDMEEDPR